MSIEAGTYKARAGAPETAQFGYTKNDNEQIAVVFTIVEGPHEGHRITWFGNFSSEKSTEIAVKALRACGWAGNDMSDLTGIDSLDVEIVVELEEYDGKTRTKVKWVNALGGGAVKLEKTMSDAQRRAFAARMRGVAAGVAPIGGARAPAPRSPGPAAPSGSASEGFGRSGGDDIPF